MRHARETRKGFSALRDERSCTRDLDEKGTCLPACGEVALLFEQPHRVLDGFDGLNGASRESENLRVAEQCVGALADAVRRRREVNRLVRQPLALTDVS